MFRPKTKRIEKIAERYPKRIKRLEKLFFGEVNIYIDYANVRPWSDLIFKKLKILFATKNKLT